MVEVDLDHRRFEEITPKVQGALTYPLRQAYSPDGRWLALSGRIPGVSEASRGAILLLERATGRVEVLHSSERVYDLMWDPGGRLYAFERRSGKLLAGGPSELKVIGEFPPGDLAFLDPGGNGLYIAKGLPRLTIYRVNFDDNECDKVYELESWAVPEDVGSSVDGAQITVSLIGPDTGPLILDSSVGIKPIGIESETWVPHGGVAFWRSNRVAIVEMVPGKESDRVLAITLKP